MLALTTPKRCKFLAHYLPSGLAISLNLRYRKVKNPISIQVDLEEEEEEGKESTSVDEGIPITILSLTTHSLMPSALKLTAPVLIQPRSHFYEC